MHSKEIVPELSDKEFENYVKKGYVLIDFFADWCMPCIMMAPIMEELSQKFKGKIKFAKVNIDENNELADKYNVASIPNFILFKDGEKVHQFMGSSPKEEFERNLKKFV